MQKTYITNSLFKDKDLRPIMLQVGNKPFSSRLFTGTGKFSDNKTMAEAIKASDSELVTVAIRRVSFDDHDHNRLLASLKETGVSLLPNTSGARTAEEAIFAAQLAKEALETAWIKVEIHPDPRYLMPDPVETLKACETLVKQGFTVLPYCHADPVLCKRLEEVGCATVMPLGSPIGSNMGLRAQEFLSMIIEQSQIPVVIDAGIGSPSDAALAMEMGADAVLVNTAIAVADSPVSMAHAFKQAVEAGRTAWESGLGQRQLQAEASSPLTGFLDR